MRIVVDFEKCKSHARCAKAAPEIFEVREDGFLYILQEQPDETQRKKVEAAIRGCPEKAISIEG